MFMEKMWRSLSTFAVHFYAYANSTQTAQHTVNGCKRIELSSTRYFPRVTSSSSFTSWHVPDWRFHLLMVWRLWWRKIIRGRDCMNIEQHVRVCIRKYIYLYLPIQYTYWKKTLLFLLKTCKMCSNHLSVKMTSFSSKTWKLLQTETFFFFFFTFTNCRVYTNAYENAYLGFHQNFIQKSSQSVPKSFFDLFLRTVCFAIRWKCMPSFCMHELEHEHWLSRNWFF